MSKENFKKALDFLYPSEGGCSNNKNDKGGPTNMGVTQATYNYYCRKNNLPAKNVKYITRDEATKVYYDEYWKGSGADKISETNPKMAVAVFDTAVLHGAATAKNYYEKSGGDLNKFLEIRQQSYDKIVAKDPTQKDFYKGWNNRVDNLKSYLNKTDFKSSYQDNSQNATLKTGVEVNVDENGNRIFTREEIGKMTSEEFQQNEKDIMKQLKEQGIPTKAQADVKSKASSGNNTKSNNGAKSSGSSSSGDGNWVTINGNHVLLD